ncbi:MAG: protease modulator HflK, partial [Planctomycetales bacterium]
LCVIGPDERAAVTRFGRFREVLEPGLNWRLPPPLETVHRVQPDLIRRVNIGLNLDAATNNNDDATSALGSNAVAWESRHATRTTGGDSQESLLLTGDETLATVSAVVSYRVQPKQLRRYVFGSQRPDVVLQSAGEHVLRAAAARKGLDDLLTGDRAKLEQESLIELGALIERYRLGVEVVGFTVSDLHPSIDVVASYREVAGAFEERQRIINDARTYYQQEVVRAGGKELVDQLEQRSQDEDEQPLAEQDWRALLAEFSGGESAAILQEALRDQEKRTLGAAGDAARFERRQEAFREAARLNRTRLLWATLENALRDRRKLLLDPQAVGRRRVFLGDPNRFTSPNFGMFAPDPANLNPNNPDPANLNPRPSAGEVP